MKKAFDPVEFFSAPGLHELLDYASTKDDDTKLIGARKGNPCMYMCTSYLHGADKFYLGLRMPKYSNGMDLEDDGNREKGNPWALVRGSKGEFYKATDDAYAIDLWNYIFDPDTSPWRKALRNPEFIKNKDGEIIAVSLGLDDKVDAQIFVSMCIAARIPWENLGHLRVWGKLRDAGFSTTDALFVAVHIRELKSGNYDFRTCAGHFAFAPFDTDISYKWMKDGTPHTLGRLARKGQYYEYVDHIWDVHKRTASKSYTQRDGRSIRENTLYKCLMEEVEYGGAFAKAFHKVTGSTTHAGLGDMATIINKLNATRKVWRSV